MTLWVDIARVAIALNVVALTAVLVVWGRNYLRIRSKHTLGLALFGVFLLAENLLALYFYNFHPVLQVWVTEVPRIAQIAMTALRVLEFAGVTVLAWTTWD